MTIAARRRRAAPAAPPSRRAATGSPAIEYRAPATLTPYPQNPRENDAAVAAVAASIEAFGFRQPIVVDAAGQIIVGHTRWKAAQRLGLSIVPVLVAADLTPDQARAYRIADNKTADLATWHLGRLAGELASLESIDWSRFGFGEKELVSFVATRDGAPAAAPLPLAEPSATLKCPSCGYTWIDD
jgi:ParB-like chromosome segregation protein Spo0J